MERQSGSLTIASFVSLIACGPFGPGVVALEVIRDPAAPEHVVADVETADADARPAELPGLGVIVLVDVAVDDVELAVGGVEAANASLT